MLKSLIFTFNLLIEQSIYCQSNCPTEIVTGIATHYTNTSNISGTCMFPPNENPAYICAVNTAKYDTSSICGSCLQITGAVGQEIFYVIDEQPSATTNSLDLDQAGFEAILGTSTNGSGTVNWKIVSCPLTSLPLQLTISSGSSAWYYMYHILHAVNPITTVEVSINGTWTNLIRNNNNTWILAPNNVPIADIRVTDIFGEQLIIPNVDASNSSTPYFAATNFTPCTASSNGINQLISDNIYLTYEENLITINSSAILNRILISDITGKEVFQLSPLSKNQQIETSYLTKGYYSIEAIEQNGLKKRISFIIK